MLHDVNVLYNLKGYQFITLSHCPEWDHERVNKGVNYIEKKTQANEENSFNKHIITKHAANKENRKSLSLPD